MLEKYSQSLFLAGKASAGDVAAAGAQYNVDHPDGRAVSAFFLGFVFMSSLQYITCSTFVHDLFRKIREIVLRAIPLKKARMAKDVENPFGSPEKDGLLIHEEARSSIHANDHNALVFTLNLSLILASLAMLLSQLTYSDVGGSETVCAFVYAWAGMAAQLAKLIGFVILIMELGKMKVRKWELWVLWGMLLVALGFTLASNATNTGTTSSTTQIGAVFCYRRHFLLTSLGSSVANFLIELYMLLRLFSLPVPRRARLRDRLLGAKVLAITRVSSLVIFDALTVVPDAISTGIFAQFIPFSVGALIVLAVFNRAPVYTSSPLPSLVVSSKRRGSDLLAPTPFTLHFPASTAFATGVGPLAASLPLDPVTEESRDHSWCSGSPHHVPPSPSSRSRASSLERDSLRRSRRNSHAPTEHTTRTEHTQTTADSLDQASTRSVENVVISRAAVAWRRNALAFAPFPSEPVPGSSAISTADPRPTRGMAPIPRSAPADVLLFTTLGLQPSPLTLPLSMTPTPTPSRTQTPRKILESQVEFAARLEEDDKKHRAENTGTHTGSPSFSVRKSSTPASLHVPPRAEQLRSQVTVDMEYDSSSSSGDEFDRSRQPVSPGSASVLYGSDIIRVGPRRPMDARSVRSGLTIGGAPSPTYTQSSFAATARDDRRSTWRRSWAETERTSDESGSQSHSQSQSHSHSTWESLRVPTSPKSFTGRADRRSTSFVTAQAQGASRVTSQQRMANRMSYASVRSRTREELPAVREMSPDSDRNGQPHLSPLSRSPTERTERSVTRSRRATARASTNTHGTFGAGSSAASVSSRRRESARSRFDDAGSDFVSVFGSLDEPVPRPPGQAHLRPLSNARSAEDEGRRAPLAVPDVQILPATPAQGNAAQANSTSPRVWLDLGRDRTSRMQMLVRGPRPLPSAWLQQGAGNGWPLGRSDFDPDDVEYGKGGRSRSNSCPQFMLYDVQRSGSGRRRPST